MKLPILLLCMTILPTLASAEIYKWKDKDGVVRYSDVPPPSNVKLENVNGKKTPKPTGQPPLAAVEGNATAAMNKDKAATAKEIAITDKAAVDKDKKIDKVPLTKDQAAAKRAKEAEEQKKSNEAKQEELKQREESCRASKSNLATLTDGGRITKTNEKGEREYMGDADISKAKADAQKDVEKYCDN